VPATDFAGFDWAPILKGYPRPKAATPLVAQLVPAYNSCTAPNRMHAAPFSYGACNPPAMTSQQLTIGTPDANGAPANSVSQVKLATVNGAPGPADEADLRIEASLTDIRNRSDLTDYTGNLQGRISLQVTDKSNTPYPGGPGPGTTLSFPYTFSIPCAATVSTTIGSTCTLTTTADTLIPNTIVEGRRSIWRLGAVDVLDGNGGLFETQGVFVP
jgi:hypothetical protein